LAIFFEEDDAQLGEATEFFVDVLHVPIDDPCSFVDLRGRGGARASDTVENEADANGCIEQVPTYGVRDSTGEDTDDSVTLN